MPNTLVDAIWSQHLLPIGASLAKRLPELSIFVLLLCASLGILGFEALGITIPWFLLAIVFPIAAYSCIRDGCPFCLLAVLPASFVWCYIIGEWLFVLLTLFSALFAFYKARERPPLSRNALYSIVAVFMVAAIAAFLRSYLYQTSGHKYSIFFAVALFAFAALTFILAIVEREQSRLLDRLFSASVSLLFIHLAVAGDRVLGASFLYVVYMFIGISSFSIGFFIYKTVRKFDIKSLYSYLAITLLSVIGLFGLIQNAIDFFLRNLTLVPVVLFVGFLLFRAVRDNRDIVRALVSQKRSDLLRHTLTVWSPFFVFLLAGFYLSHVLYQGGLWLLDRVAAGLTLIESAKASLIPSAAGATAAATGAPGTEYLDMIFLLSNVLLFFLVIKSLLYVFARVAVSRQNGIPATLGAPGAGAGSPDNPPPEAPFHQAQEYTLALEEGTRFYMKRNFAPSGYAPKLAVPQWRSGPVRRLANGAYMMNVLEPRADRGAAHLTATGSARFVEWTLAPGEEIVFSYKHFVGMSESVRLSTHLSLRITGLVFGEVFHACARGPGKIVLLTVGKANLFADGGQAFSSPRSRLLAWRRSAQFDVEAESRAVDVFFSGVYLQCTSPDPIVIDADERSAPQGGLSRFAKQFLLPF